MFLLNLNHVLTRLGVSNFENSSRTVNSPEATVLFNCFIFHVLESPKLVVFLHSRTFALVTDCLLLKTEHFTSDQGMWVYLSPSSAFELSPLLLVALVE